MRFCKRKGEFRIVENDKISITALGGKQPMKTKRVEQVRKVIDAGGWYIIIFKSGDISNSWICEKNLIVKEIFAEKLMKAKK